MACFVNLLEKQLSTIYFKDVRFSWVTLYMSCVYGDWLLAYRSC